MTNAAYWAKRFATLEASANTIGHSTYATVEPAFLQAQKEIQAQIDKWLVRVAKNNQVTMAEARKLLTTKELAEFQWDVDEYIKYGQQNELDGAWIKQLENASAKVHISRLEALQISTQQSMEKAFGNELDAVDTMAREIFTQDYYHTCYEIQKGTNVGFNIGQIDDKRLEKIISKPWTTDNKTFSDRIWQSKTQMVADLQTELTRTCLFGKSPSEAIESMTQYVDAKCKNAKAQAGRLVMTEQAFFASAAQKEAFSELDVEEYEIVATLDAITSAICQQMDGKHFPMGDFKAGVTAPPFHPWCRSCTCPYFDDEFSQDGYRASRTAEGKTVYEVPADMTYPEWEEAFVEGDVEGLQSLAKSDTIIAELDKLSASGMSEADYQEYLNCLNSHGNEDVRRLYAGWADEINGVNYTRDKGYYRPSDNTLSFSYPKYDDMNKYGTLTHEYGHYFDEAVDFGDTLHFTETTAVLNAVEKNQLFKLKASASDEFLEAVRKDREHLKTVLTSKAKGDLCSHNASSGVQDAIDGLFANSRLQWGHGEKYYNRTYVRLDSYDKMYGTSLKKELQQVYKSLGMDASSLAKTKVICRQYEAASEIWANVLSAEVCGGGELQYVKTYLPNSYEALLKILKGVK